MSTRLCLLSLALFAGLAPPALAQEQSAAIGHFQIRLRGVAVLPDPSATIIVSGVNIGGTTKVSDSAVPEADLTYFLTDHIAVEAIAAVTKHSVSNSAAGPVGTVWLLPPTVTLQYHLDPNAALFRPYIGAGINYTAFYDAHSALPNIGFKNNLGWALQVGVDVPVGDGPYFLNLDVKKLFLNTSIKAAGGAVRAKASLDPWLIGVGVGIRF